MLNPRRATEDSYAGNGRVAGRDTHDGGELGRRATWTRAFLQGVLTPDALSGEPAREGGGRARGATAVLLVSETLSDCRAGGGPALGFVRHGELQH